MTRMRPLLKRPKMQKCASLFLVGAFVFSLLQCLVLINQLTGETHIEYHTGYSFNAGESLLGGGDANNDDSLVVSPFRELPPGPSSYLFWTGESSHHLIHHLKNDDCDYYVLVMGVGKDSYMFQNFGVYPFDRLNDTERIIVLTEVPVLPFALV